MITSLTDLPKIKLRQSLDGLYIGCYLAGVFYGFTTHQAFLYFQRSKNDPTHTRVLLLFLWILDTLHAVLATVSLRQLVQESIVHGALQTFLENTPWALSLSLFMMSISDSGVRGFYCFRIWRFSQKNWILTSISIFPAGCALIAGLYSASRTVRTLDLTPEFDVTLISICVTDSILAGILCVLLWNSRCGIKRTNSVLSTLILYTITTGLLTSVVAIATLIVMLVLKGTFAYVGAFYILSKLYFSSLLATLNRREKIRNQMEGTSAVVSFPIPAGQGGSWPKEMSFMAFTSGGVGSESSGTMSYRGIVEHQQQRQWETQTEGPQEEMGSVTISWGGRRHD